MFYRDYLNYCLEDKDLTEKEAANLMHLKSILGLADMVAKIYNELCESAYGKFIEEAISNGRLDPNARARLEQIKHNLKLSDEVAQKIYLEKSHKYLKQYLDSTISDERLSDDEEKEINAISNSLGIKVEYGEKTLQLLAKYRYLWLIEHGEIPEISVNINLKRNEKCYFSCNVNWFEHRQVTDRVRYSGPTLRIRLAKGLYWRMGDLAIRTVSKDIFAHIDSGTIYLTRTSLINGSSPAFS